GPQGRAAAAVAVAIETGYVLGREHRIREMSGHVSRGGLDGGAGVAQPALEQALELVLAHLRLVTGHFEAEPGGHAERHEHDQEEEDGLTGAQGRRVYSVGGLAVTEAINRIDWSPACAATCA